MEKLPSSNTNIFKFFKGRWDLSRQIRDNSTKEITHIMKGTARFISLSIDRTLYEEAVYINEYSTGTKKYLFILSDTAISQYRFMPSSKPSLFSCAITNPDIIKMYELNFIQAAPLKKMISSGSYLCPPDQYDVTYTLNSEKNFSILYDIIGPDKYQTIDTTYTRTKTELVSLKTKTITY